MTWHEMSLSDLIKTARRLGLESFYNETEALRGSSRVKRMESTVDRGKLASRLLQSSEVSVTAVALDSDLGV